MSKPLAPPSTLHRVNYLDFYREVIESEGAKATFLFSNDCRYIASFCDQVLCCDIHTRERNPGRAPGHGQDRPSPWLT